MLGKGLSHRLAVVVDTGRRFLRTAVLSRRLGKVLKELLVRCWHLGYLSGLEQLLLFSIQPDR